VEDSQVVEAFVNEGARRAFGPTLHVEGDYLFFDGWWQAAIRISPRTFAIRDEEPPGETDVAGQVGAALAARGLQDVGADFPIVGAITYAEIALPPVAWSVWAPDADTGGAELNERAGRDAFLGDETSPVPVDVDYGAELGGARRLSGLPPSLVLALGVDAATTQDLAAVLPECRFESRALEAVTPEVCGSLLPTLMLIDATAQSGRDFIMEMRAAACGRVIPVVALTTDASVPLGADSAVDPATPPLTWVQRIRALLP
jgi:hypothetical protein